MRRVEESLSGYSQSRANHYIYLDKLELSEHNSHGTRNAVCVPRDLAGLIHELVSSQVSKDIRTHFEIQWIVTFP